MRRSLSRFRWFFHERQVFLQKVSIILQSLNYFPMSSGLWCYLCREFCYGFLLLYFCFAFIWWLNSGSFVWYVSALLLNFIVFSGCYPQKEKPRLCRVILKPKQNFFNLCLTVITIALYCNTMHFVQKKFPLICIYKCLLSWLHLCNGTWAKNHRISYSR